MIRQGKTIFVLAAVMSAVIGGLVAAPSPLAAASAGSQIAAQDPPETDPDADEALVEAATEGDLARVRLLLGKGPARPTLNAALLEGVINTQRTNNTLDIARLLLDSGADPNARDEDGFTVLMRAAVGNYGNGDTAGVVKLLLDRGADVSAKSEGGFTALIGASGCPDAETLRLLLDKNADVNAKTAEGGTALMAAAGQGYADTVKLLIARGADVNAVQKGLKRTALHFAAMVARGPGFGRLEEAGTVRSDYAATIRALLDAGADTGIRDFNGWTALVWAQTNDDPGVTRLLMGAFDKAAGNQALLGAAGHGNVRTMQMLLGSGADVNARDPATGTTPLLAAARSGRPDTVRLLLDRGANVRARDKQGRTALMRASEFRWTGIGAIEQPNEFEAIAGLLLSRGAEVNAVDRRGATALILARRTARRSRGERGGAGGDALVTLLRKAGAKNSGGKGFDLVPALSAAVERDDRGAVERLLKAGARLNFEDDDNRTPLLRAASRGDLALVRLLIRHGADIRDTLDSGFTPLVAAATGRNLRGSTTEVLRLLLDKGVSVNTRDERDDGTALMGAAFVGSLPNVRLLLDRKAAVNARDWRGETALMKAAQQGHVAVMRLLLERGADARAKNRDDQTALDLAIKNKQSPAAQLLRGWPKR